jgi:DNA replicative helicase MCM subunit Mcm2 (Cdc46/Mcm family)
VFATVIQANFITKKDDKLAAANLTDEDIKAVVQLSKDERIGERVSSFIIYTTARMDYAKSCGNDLCLIIIIIYFFFFFF